MQVTTHLKTVWHFSKVERYFPGIEKPTIDSYTYMYVSTQYRQIHMFIIYSNVPNKHDVDCITQSQWRHWGAFAPITKKV